MVLRLPMKIQSVQIGPFFHRGFEPAHGGRQIIGLGTETIVSDGGTNARGTWIWSGMMTHSSISMLFLMTGVFNNSSIEIFPMDDNIILRSMIFPK